MQCLETPHLELVRLQRRWCWRSRWLAGGLMGAAESNGFSILMSRFAGVAWMTSGMALNWVEARGLSDVDVVLNTRQTVVGGLENSVGRY